MVAKSNLIIQRTVSTRAENKKIAFPHGAESSADAKVQLRFMSRSHYTYCYCMRMNNICVCTSDLGNATCDLQGARDGKSCRAACTKGVRMFKINKTTNSGRVKHTLFHIIHLARGVPMPRRRFTLAARWAEKSTQTASCSSYIILHLRVCDVCARSTGIIRVRTRR